MSTDESSQSSDVDIVRQAARDGEMDRYIAAVMAPARIRNDLVALAAFAAVIGHIPEATREPAMREIRLQWWRDALLLGARGEATGHPVADALAATRRRHGLPALLLDGVIDAVSDAFMGEAPASAEPDRPLAMIEFESRLFAAAAHVHAGAPVTGCETLFDQAGTAYGLARALCRLPSAIACGWPRLPSGLAGDAQQAGGSHQSIDIAALRRLHATARHSLDDVIRRQVAAPEAAVAALWPLVMVEPYLDAQSRNLETLLVSSVEVLPLKRMWRIWRAHRRHGL